MAALTVSKEEEKRVKGIGFLRNKGTDCFSGRVLTKSGKITAEQQVTIGEAARLYGNGIVLFTSRLCVEVQGIPYEKIDEFCAYIAKAGLTTGGTGPKVRPVVSCKGTTCRFGLIDTQALAERIHDRFFEGYREVNLPHKFKIAVGGCPNNCVKPDLNDLGIMGQMFYDFDAEKCRGCKKCGVEKNCPADVAKVSEKVLAIDKDECLHCGRCVGNCYFDALTGRTNGYQIYIGGRWGRKQIRGKKLSKIFSSEDEVLSVIEKAILLYKEQGKLRERFAQTVERIGFEKAEAQLISDEILERKQEILDKDIC